MRKNVFLLFKIFLSVLIFVWIFRSVNISETFKVLSKTNLIVFFWAFSINNSSNFFLTIKWHRLASPLKIKSNFLELLKLNYISVFYSIFIPGQASGELIKGIKLAKKEEATQKVWVPIVIDKITNLLVVFFIGLLAILSDKTFSQNRNLLLIVTLCTALLGFITIVVFSEHTNNLIGFIKNLLVKFLRIFKINTRQVENFSLNYFENYKKHDFLLLETLFWSFTIKIPHVFTFYLLALSLNINLNVIESAWLFSIVSIASILPISFSGLGIREGTIIVLLSQVGIEKSAALSLSMLIFTTGILTGLIGGVLEVFSGFRSKKK